jgi:hypothetical protein
VTNETSETARALANSFEQLSLYKIVCIFSLCVGVCVRVLERQRHEEDTSSGMKKFQPLALTNNSCCQTYLPSFLRVMYGFVGDFFDQLHFVIQTTATKFFSFLIID